MEQLLTVTEVSDLLKISPNTLRSWVWQQRELGKKRIRVGRLVRFRMSDVEEWLNENIRRE